MIYENEFRCCHVTTSWPARTQQSTSTQAAENLLEAGGVGVCARTLETLQRSSTMAEALLTPDIVRRGKVADYMKTASKLQHLSVGLEAGPLVYALRTSRAPDAGVIKQLQGETSVWKQCFIKATARHEVRPLLYAGLPNF